MRINVFIVLAFCVIFFTVGFFLGKKISRQVVDQNGKKVKGKFVSQNGVTAELSK